MNASTFSRSIALAIGVTLVAAAPRASAGGEDVLTYTQFELIEPFEFEGQGLSVLNFPQLDGELVESRADIVFTTTNGFDAADVSLFMTAPVDQLGGFGSWVITGADLGWMGEGTFEAHISTDALVGNIDPAGFWEMEISPVFGIFDTLTIEHDYIPVPAPAAMALLPMAVIAGARRRRRD